METSSWPCGSLINSLETWGATMGGASPASDALILCEASTFSKLLQTKPAAMTR